jgi:predicted porin
MTKKLLPTMIGVALAGGMAAAQADVTVFGQIDESIVNSQDYVTSGNDTNFVCTTCSIGFKGSEDLGNGLKAIFKIDFQYDINNRNNGKVSQSKNTTGVVTNVTGSADSITDRDQWLGLAGNFGQVRVGTISTTYKSHGAMLDPAYRTVVQQRDWLLQSVLHSGAGQQGQGRSTNTARYDSPDWNGLKVMATYTLDSTNQGQNENPYGFGAQYENGGILVFADYLTTDQGSNDSAYKAGAKYTINNFAVFGQYEFDNGLISTNSFGLPVNNPNSVQGADVWMLGTTYTMGNNTLYGAYAQGDNAQNINFDTSYDAWEIAGIHSMSKQTFVYLGYGQISPNESNTDDATAWALGMQHKF